MKTDAEKIEEIMSNFDFERVSEAMCLLKWVWGAGSEAAQPSVYELIQTARRLLDSVAAVDLGEDAYASTGTGGFHADVIQCSDGERIFSLKFCVATWDNRE